MTVIDKRYAAAGLHISGSALLLYIYPQFQLSYLFLLVASLWFAAALLFSSARVMGKQGAALLLLSAGVARIMAAGVIDVSDDVYRYLWEGKVFAAGFNPYVLAPIDPQLQHLRDWMWPLINHPSISAIYGPTFQLLMAGVAKLWYSPIAVKLVMLTVEAVFIVVLVFAVRQWKIPLTTTALYILNPLAIVYIAGEAHLEIFVVLFFFTALIASYKNKHGWAFVLLGLAFTVKPIVAIFIPLLITKKSMRFLPLFFLPAVSYLPFLDAKTALFSALSAFATQFHYNGLFFSLFSFLFGPENALPLCVAVAFMAAVAVFFLTPDRFRAGYLLAGILLLFLPTVHPWYLLLITPFIIFYRSAAWITLHLSCLVLFFYFQSTNVQHPLWHNRWLLFAIEYTPFVLLGLYEICMGKHSGPQRFEAVKDVTVVIPTLNEAKHIARLLNQVVSADEVCEVLVVDGGSRDATVQLGEQMKSTLPLGNKISVITSATGRGIQIEQGVKRARGDVTCVIHADATFDVSVFKRMIDALNTGISASGGAFGARYNHTGIRFRFTEFLNNMRVLWTGISFGDQGQFFRTRLMRNNIPRIALMEDIEIAFRLKQLGSLLFIPRGIISSTRMWKRQGYIGNFVKVISLTLLFIFRRRFGLLEPQCNDFYRWYYGKAPAEQS